MRSRTIPKTIKRYEPISDGDSGEHKPVTEEIQLSLTPLVSSFVAPVSRLVRESCPPKSISVHCWSKRKTPLNLGRWSSLSQADTETQETQNRPSYERVLIRIKLPTEFPVPAALGFKKSGYAASGGTHTSVDSQTPVINQ